MPQVTPKIQHDDPTLPLSATSAMCHVTHFKIAINTGPGELTKDPSGVKLILGIP